MVTNLIWMAKVPLEVRAFVMTLALGWINTNESNDMLQRRRTRLDLSPYIQLLCRVASELCPHVFLHYERTLHLGEIVCLETRIMG